MEKASGKVKIRVSTVQDGANGKDSYKNNYEGSLFFKNDTWFLFYDEKDEDGNKQAECTVRANYGKVEIVRHGAYSSKLIYEVNKPYKTMYKTPYGELEIVIKAHKVTVALGGNEGKIILDYEMMLSGEKYNNIVAIEIENNND